ncbi:pseudoazurin [Thalassotalea marina]|uniref:Pseudoazurin n=1 Tax=Thalassotalea marina TaxID=1673741 RepID=A0A919BP52_9GAMM|nr:pseudoazurin [Thalassotalea marina]GHG02818.1 pseudoazurin [Thalassotalea marina]
MNVKNLFIFAISFVFSSAVFAKNHQVKLLTMADGGQSMMMSPGFIKIDKGDTITFIPSDATHNAESIALPNNATAFNSAMGTEVTITFSAEGVYLYKCTPHFALGMLGVIQVGAPNNLEQVKNKWQQIKSGVVMNQERVEQYLAQVK